MKLYSTNNHSNIVDLREAVLNAFPKDRGLYMPCVLPELKTEFLNNLRNHSFQEIALHISKVLIGDSVDSLALEKIIGTAINFPAPVKSIEDNLSVLELFHGPTMAFKDFGARFMAGLMAYFLRNENKVTTILVATSGDTGGAVASGFHKVPGIEVIILYPSGMVSPLQEKQLTTWGDNIRAIEIDGVFDDCQKLVKDAFVDATLRDKYSFSSANSINIARLIPQSFYYFEAYKQIDSHHKNICFSVPSGNFGNLTAGLFAKKMGLPVKHFLAATNINNVVPKYLETGNYTERASVPTLSNAMDVGAPSNFVRIMELYGSTWNLIKKDLLGSYYTDEQVKNQIKEAYINQGYLLDPHGAIAYMAAKQHLKSHPMDYCVFLETAHPAKFDNVVNGILEKQIEIPEKLEKFLLKDKVATKCSKDFLNFRELLMFG